uniref:Uncharacterized protein n=1 Tax=Oryza punctata TaxID=4537 RepID=A0A0E0JGE2_ORYPU
MGVFVGAARCRSVSCLSWAVPVRAQHKQAITPLYQLGRVPQSGLAATARPCASPARHAYAVAWRPPSDAARVLLCSGGDPDPSPPQHPPREQPGRGDSLPSTPSATTHSRQVPRVHGRWRCARREASAAAHGLSPFPVPRSLAREARQEPGGVEIGNP